MSRIANERTILVIESIVDSDRPSLEAVSWRSHDVDCRRDRHRFVGQSYAFYIEILEMCFTRKSHMLWHLIVVTERWQRPGLSGSDLRTSKWLKQLAGKNSDVVDWIRDCRPLFATSKDSLDQE
jgi:hypothetical protein